MKAEPWKFFGMRVVVVPRVQRYVLPEELMPGVPWPKGFRQEINEWSKSFLGETSSLLPGEVLIIGDAVHMDINDYAHMRDKMAKVML